MKPGLQFRLNQQLTLTPQLQQAIRLLQLSQLELEAELRQIAESNPLLEFAEDAESEADAADDEGFEAADYTPPRDEVPKKASKDDDESTAAPSEELAPDWDDDRFHGEAGDYAGAPSRAGGVDDDGFEPQNAAPESLQQHLEWQLNLSQFSPRDHAIATAIIHALDEDGYLRDGVEAVEAALPAELGARAAEIETVRQRVQRFDPTGIASLDLRD